MLRYNLDHDDNKSVVNEFNYVLRTLRASGATVRNQLLNDQWAYQQRMLALYPGDASKCLLFQDSAGTIPVTAMEQPVGLRLDYETAGAWNGTDAITSIPGAHMRQVTSTKRPVLRQYSDGTVYLDYDGIDDAMVAAAALAMPTVSFSVLIPSNVLSDTAGFPTSLSLGSWGTSGSFLMINNANIAYAGVTPTGAGGFGPAVVNPANARRLTSASVDGAAGILRVRSNKSNSIAFSVPANTTHLTSTATEGSRSDNLAFWTGHIGGYLLIDRLLTPYQQSVIERYINRTWRAF